MCYEEFVHVYVCMLIVVCTCLCEYVMRSMYILFMCACFEEFVHVYVRGMCYWHTSIRMLCACQHVLASNALTMSISECWHDNTYETWMHHVYVCVLSRICKPFCVVLCVYICVCVLSCVVGTQNGPPYFNYWSILNTTNYVSEFSLNLDLLQHHL